MAADNPSNVGAARRFDIEHGGEDDDEGVVDEELEDQRLLEQGRRKHRTRRALSVIS